MAFDRSMSVLVVDERDAEIQIIRALLRQLGFADVDGAHDVAEALASMRAKRYGLVISGWLVEPGTGCELVREARGDPRLQRTPFILSGEPRPENVIAAKKAGANCYIVKPFNAGMLKLKIEATFATRTAPLPERQPPRPGEASETKPTDAADKHKFDGLFTSSI